MLNNRPLIEVNDHEVITPAHILGGGNPNFDSDFTGLDRDAVREAVLREQNNLPHLFRQAQERLTVFWQALWDQYLMSLRFSVDKRGNKYKKIPKKGDVCIVWSKDPRRKWKKAIILEVIPSADGAIRECKIKMDTVVTTRPVNQLYSLEITAEEFTKDEDQQVKTDSGVVQKIKQKGSKERGQVSPEVLRPRRAAAIAALERNRELLLQDHNFR